MDGSEPRQAALVTGASYGIGATIALAFAKAGFDVAVTATKAANLDEIAPKLESAGARVLPLALELRSQESIGHAMEMLFSTFEHVTVLVNNAGTTLRGPAVDVTPEDWRTVLDTNLMGTFFVTQRFGRHLLDAGRPGAVITITSTHGVVGVPDRVLYGISKAALNHMTKLLAVEWAKRGIRVNAIAPGRILTDSPKRTATRADPTYMEAMLRRIPMNRMATEDEIAAAALFLAGPGAKTMTGQTLVIDGGLTAA